FDPAVFRQARHDGTVPDDFGAQGHVVPDAADKNENQRPDQEGVHHDTGPEHLGQPLARGFLHRQPAIGAIAYQATFVAHVVHDLVTGVDTGAAVDAFV